MLARRWMSDAGYDQRWPVVGAHGLVWRVMAESGARRGSRCQSRCGIRTPRPWGIWCCWWAPRCRSPPSPGSWASRWPAGPRSTGRRARATSRGAAHRARSQAARCGGDALRLCGATELLCGLGITPTARFEVGVDQEPGQLFFEPFHVPNPDHLAQEVAKLLGQRSVRPMSGMYEGSLLRKRGASRAAPQLRNHARLSRTTGSAVSPGSVGLVVRLACPP